MGSLYIYVLFQEKLSYKNTYNDRNRFLLILMYFYETPFTCIYQPEPFPRLPSITMKFQLHDIIQCRKKIDTCPHAANRRRSVPIKHVQPIGTVGRRFLDCEVNDIEFDLLFRMGSGQGELAVLVVRVVVRVTGCFDVTELAGDVRGRGVADVDHVGF